MKIEYLDKDELIADYIKHHPEYAGKKLSAAIYDKGFSIKCGRQLLLTASPNSDDVVYREAAKVYGYARISRPQQSIERQKRNIQKEFPRARLFEEAYTGTKMDRPVWNRLLSQINEGDTIVFDSVSRMSRNADEGIETYFQLYERNVNLIFLKEHYIDTAMYAENMRDRIELQGTDEDEIFKGLNNYFRKLAARQIRVAFDQAEKEVQDLHQRTREGIETARLKGKQIGQTPGRKLIVKKAAPAKEMIMKYSKDFDGTLADPEVIKIIGIGRNTYYRYKKELRNAL